jgi:hypothetical protein
VRTVAGAWARPGFSLAALAAASLGHAGSYEIVSVHTKLARSISVGMGIGWIKRVKFAQILGGDRCITRGTMTPPDRAVKAGCLRCARVLLAYASKYPDD